MRVAWGWLVLAMNGCLEPTQIKLEITTDVPCAKLGPAKIYTDDTPSAEGICRDGVIGSLVLIPSGKPGPVTVRVEAPYDGGSCEDDKRGCIRASRRVSYVPRTPLRMPIALRESCVDVRCAPNLTCVAGQCRPDEIACEKGVCEEDTLGPPRISVTDVAVGNAIDGPAGHSCAVLSTGALYCWGVNGAFQLGLGNTMQGAPSPALVGLANVKEVGVGQTSSCARTADGRVHCWGAYGHSQLGLGPKTCCAARSTPAMTPLTEVTSLGVGEYGACAVASGALQCWGIYAANWKDAESPVPVALPGPVTYARYGQTHWCALLADESVHCWGNNGAGAVGVPDKQNQMVPPTRIALPKRIKQLSVHLSRTCALDESGDVRCWGDGNPALGVAPIKGASAVTTGLGFTCAIVGASAFCWGQNNFGQLGDGTLNPNMTPVKLALPPVTKVVAGANGACAIALGELYCWGRNDAGQAGTGAPSPPVMIPTKIAIPTVGDPAP